MQSKGKISNDGSSRVQAKGLKAVSRSEKAGLQFPVGRTERLLKKGKYASRISSDTPVYLAGVLEYLAAEVLDLAGETAKHIQENCITPSLIKVVIEQDEELNKLLGNVTFPSSSFYRIDQKLSSKGPREGEQAAINSA